MLSLFFFEHVPSLRPPEVVERTGLEALQMWRCKALMPRYGGGLMGVESVFRPHYLAVWCHHIGAVELYPYVGMNFRGDLDFLALVGEP